MADAARVDFLLDDRRLLVFRPELDVPVVVAGVDEVAVRRGGEALGAAEEGDCEVSFIEVPELQSGIGGACEALFGVEEADGVDRVGV